MAGAELIGKEEMKEVKEVLETGVLMRYGFDQQRKGVFKVKEFEQAFAQYCGAKFALGVTSGSAALKVALKAMDVGPGDEVIVPAFTFLATYEAVMEVGAVPVMGDIDDTLNLDPQEIERKKTPYTKAVIPVHMCGSAARIDKIVKIAKKNKILVLEDNAQGCGASFKGKKLGTFGDMGIFSFDYYKTITTGEGGMAVTGDAELAARMRQMSLHGLSHDAWKRYTGGGSWDYRIEAPGYKYNLTDIAAAIGLHQLRRAETLRLRREDLAHRYLAALAGVDELELPPVPENRLHSWHLFPIRLRLDELTLDRNGFIDELRSRGVGCSVHWRPLHLHPYYERTFGWRPEDLPTASRIWERLISLPLFPDLQEAEWQHVVTCVRGLCERHKRSGTPIIRRKAA